MVANDANGRLRAEINTAIDWLVAHNKRLPMTLVDLAVYHAIKTPDFYLRVLYTWVNDLSTGEVSENEFIDKMAALIEQQLTRAWNEGMRENEIDPSEMDDDMRAQLTQIITDEYMFVDQFAADIAGGKYSLAQLQNRAAIWANRYNEVVNIAKLATAKLKDKFEWIYGDTEHCDTCAQLNGLVATAKEWEISGIKPQNPPNDNLSCGGWKCQCKLQPTTKRRSPKVLDTLLTLGMKSGKHLMGEHDQQSHAGEGGGAGDMGAGALSKVQDIYKGDLSGVTIQRGENDRGAAGHVGERESVFLSSNQSFTTPEEDKQQLQNRINRYADKLKGQDLSDEERAGFTEKLNQYKDKLDSYIPYTMPENEDEIIVHELGHVISAQVAMGKIEGVTDLLPPSQNPTPFENTMMANFATMRDQYPISEYGNKDFDEYFSEAFVLYVRGDTEKIHPDLLDLFVRISK